MLDHFESVKMKDEKMFFSERENVNAHVTLLTKSRNSVQTTTILQSLRSPFFDAVVLRIDL